MTGKLHIETRTGANKTSVSISGSIEENADLTALMPLSGTVEINLRGIRRFNSGGVREWINAIRPLSGRAQLLFAECSAPVVHQLNMISGFLGRGRVVSFIGPMRCEACDLDVDHLFEPADCEDLLPRVPCPRCGRAMELDEAEDQYLLFLREPTSVR